MNKWKYLVLTFLLLFAVQILAQTNTVALALDAPPQTVDQLVALLIPVITTGIIWLIGKIPQLPRPLLPVLSLGIGPLVGYGMTFVSNLKLTPGQLVIMGGLAVTFREITNQMVTKQFKPLEGSKTETKPVDGAVVSSTNPVPPAPPVQP